MESSSINIEKIEYEFGDDWDIFEELISDYTEHFSVVIDKIKASIEANDATTVKIEGHTLKGIVSNFYDEDFRRAAFNIELCGDSGDLSNGVELLDIFIKRHHEVMNFLNNYVENRAKLAS